MADKKDSKNDKSPLSETKIGRREAIKRITKGTALVASFAFPFAIARAGNLVAYVRYTYGRVHYYNYRKYYNYSKYSRYHNSYHNKYHNRYHNSYYNYSKYSRSYYNYSKYSRYYKYYKYSKYSRSSYYNYTRYGYTDSC